LNICIFSRDFYPSIGGLERIAQILASYAASLGYQIEVVTDTYGKSDEDDRQFPFRITRTSEYRVRVRAFRRADAVLFMNVSLHGILAAIVADTPVIFSHHGIYRGRGLVGKLLELIKRQLTRFYSNISVSQFVAKNIPAASVVIHNAYDNVSFKQPEHPARVRDFVFCGRLVTDKGADMAIQAFARVLESLPDALLTIIGDGPERQALQALAQSIGISEKVRFTGKLAGQDLVDELQRHVCMVVPSLWEEPFGIVALEGIACCETIIAARRGGLPEAVGDCGSVVEPTVEKFSAAMIVVAQAREAAKTLPNQMKTEMRNTHLKLHYPEAVTRQYLDVIEQAILHRSKQGCK